jgi:hypothetical protein
MQLFTLHKTQSPRRARLRYKIITSNEKPILRADCISPTGRKVYIDYLQQLNGALNINFQQFI